MLTLTLKNKETYNVPENWSELTMGQYINLANLITKYGEMDITDNIFENEIVPQILKALFNIDEKQLKKFTVVEFHKVKNAINFINKPLPKFTPKMETVSNGYKIKIVNVDEMKFGTWADVNHLLTSDPINNIPLAFSMVVNIEKQNKWYKKWMKNKPIDDSEYLDVIKQQPMSEIFAINNFFLLTTMLLKQNILSSSLPVEMKVQVMKQFSLLDGLTTFG
jgi:hypothetical protein